MFKWFLMLSKRLYKKAMFIGLLFLIPLLVLSLGAVSKEKSGFVSVALAQFDNEDKISNEIINDLLDDNKLIKFEYCSSPETAVEMVKTGEFDSAWVFHDDLKEKTEDFALKPNENNCFVDVYEREDNVLLKLCHEKLSGVAYKYCAKSLYLNYTRKNFEYFKGTPDSELLKEFDLYSANARLFEFAYPGSGNESIEKNEIDYLVAPVRGLLSVLVTLCGLAATMYYMKDEKRGTFSLVIARKRAVIEFVSQIIAVGTVSVVMLISLEFIGVTVSIIREIVVTSLFALSVALFCMLLRRVIRNVNIFSALIPLFTVLIIAICPVFFSFKVTRPLQWIFPSTYYLNGINSNICVNYFVIYILILAVLNLIFYLFNRKFGKE